MNRVLFESGLYVVCLLASVGLTVQSKRTNFTGQVMRPDHPQYAEWSAAWDDLLDACEGNTLCRAFLSN